MKKILFTISLFSSLTGFLYAQETMSSGEGKKMYLGLSGSYLISSQQHLGGRFSFEYFINNKLSVEASYTYGYSKVRNKFTSPLRPASGSVPTLSEDIITYNHLHLFGITPIYYFVGGSDATISVFGGIGLSYGNIRSSEFGEKNALNIWNGIYLTSTIGADYLLGPGKAFANAGFNPRLFTFSSTGDKDYFSSVFYVSLGYKLGF